MKGFDFDLGPRDDRQFDSNRSAFFQVAVIGVYDQLLDSVSPGDTVIDAGANIGCFTLLASRKVGPSGRVIAIEPSLHNLKLLRTNLELNQITNVAVLNKALYHASDELIRFKEDGIVGKIDDSGQSLVRTITLEDVIVDSNLSNAIAIKMDIEGAEESVFNTVIVKPKTPAGIKSFAIEIHTQESFRVVIEALERFGFEHSGALSEGDFLLPAWNFLVAHPILTYGLYGWRALPVGLRMLRYRLLRKAGTVNSKGMFETALIFAFR